MTTITHWLTNSFVVALLIATATTVPFAAATELQPAPHDTTTEIVVGVQGPGSQGYVVQYDSRGDEVWRYGNAASYHDVTVLPNGNILTSYATGNANDCGPYPEPCARTGVRIIDPNPRPHVVWQHEQPVRSMMNSEIHDVEPHPDGVVYVDMDSEQIVVVNRSTNETRVVWDAADSYRPPEDETREDWLHINDVDRINESTYLVSVRNRNQLLLIDTECQCERGVINKDEARNDSLREADPLVMRGQHNPQWLDRGAVLVADSSNNRIVELHRVEGEWKPAWAIERARGKTFYWPRDADRLPNGNTLVTDSRNHRVLEIDENGTVHAEWQTAQLPYEADAIRAGERVGADRYKPNDVPAADGEGNWPLIGPIYVGLHHSTGLPPWVTQGHMLAWIISVGLVLNGIGIRVEEWWRQRNGDGA